MLNTFVADICCVKPLRSFADTDVSRGHGVTAKESKTTPSATPAVPKMCEASLFVCLQILCMTKQINIFNATILHPQTEAYPLRYFTTDVINMNLKYDSRSL